jgi:prepilin-type N-terminal cleavage/methylation domain-containing protein
MIKREAGFTLIELLITMVIFVLVLAAGSQIFTGLLTQFKQQSKIAETNIEGIVGLEILKQDIEHAGYGLPWNGLITYSEASGDPFGLNDSPTDAPRAILTQNNANFSSPNDIFNGSDYLVIKAVNIARNDACQKWTTLKATSPYVRTWTPSSENLSAGDHVIVLSPGATDINRRTLVVNGAAFSTTYSSVASSPWSPTDVMEARIIYGVDDTSLRMPFNRADYFITRNRRSGENLTPSRCAPNTGVLVKAIVSHDDGDFDLPPDDGITDELPLLDCVADMQVDFWLDTDADGNINWPPSDDISGLTAQQIREQVKEVRVYVVAHEGQRDVNYDFSMNNTRESLSALEVLGGNSRTITFINLKTQIGDPDYKYYRWKVYTLVVKPNNLR